MSEQRLLNAAVIFALFTTLSAVVFNAWQFPWLWLTTDQQAQRLMNKGQFADAAKIFSDPMRQGIAFYRAGDFKSASAAFSHLSTPEAIYNRGNSLIMMGKYDDAIKSFDRCLSFRSGWKEAEDNRKIAVIRRDRLKFTGGDDVGGQIKPDEVVYEKQGEKSESSVQVSEGAPMSDSELQALWLRRVHTKTSDFLRVKFAYQSNEKSSGTP